MRLRGVGQIGLLGGAVNAALCYLRWPVPIIIPGGGFFLGSSAPHPLEFSRTIIPAGAMHGALLAGLAVALAWLLPSRPFALRCAGAVVIGWLVGWMAYVPLDLGIMNEWSWKANGMAIRAPWNGSGMEWLMFPLRSFGLVASCVVLALDLARRSPGTPRWEYLAAGSLSGSLGSLWWWSQIGMWHFSLLHGAIWGALVGYGIWKAQRLEPAISEHAR